MLKIVHRLLNLFYFLYLKIKLKTTIIENKWNGMKINK